MREGHQNRGAKQGDIDFKRLREALRTATDPQDLKSLQHELDVLTNKQASRPKFGLSPGTPLELLFHPPPTTQPSSPFMIAH